MFEQQLGINRLSVPQQISDKPTGRNGKLAVLRQVIDPQAFNSGRTYHVDDDEGVLSEIRDFSNIVPVGVRVRGKRNWRETHGVHYTDNVFEALD